MKINRYINGKAAKRMPQRPISSPVLESTLSSVWRRLSAETDRT